MSEKIKEKYGNTMKEIKGIAMAYGLTTDEAIQVHRNYLLNEINLRVEGVAGEIAGLMDEDHLSVMQSYLK